MTNFITVLYWRFSVEMFTPTKNMKQLTEWSRSITDQNATTWWRHQMETFSALLAICAGNSPVPMNSPHKGQWCGTLMFSLICVWINGWVNNREAGDLRRYRTHCDVTAMFRYRAELLHRYKKDTICHVNIAQLWDLSSCVLEKTTVLKIYCSFEYLHDDVIKWKHRVTGPFVRGIHQPSVNSPHKGHWHGALGFSLICAWINSSVNGYLRRHRAHYDVTVMLCSADVWIEEKYNQTESDNVVWRQIRHSKGTNEKNGLQTSSGLLYWGTQSKIS